MAHDMNSTDYFPADFNAGLTFEDFVSNYKSEEAFVEMPWEETSEMDDLLQQGYTSYENFYMPDINNAGKPIHVRPEQREPYHEALLRMFYRAALAN